MSNERGLALVIVMFSLALLGALVGGTFFAGRLEQQSGQNTLFAVQAAEAAEAGLSDAVASVSPEALETLQVRGPSLDLGIVTLAGGVSASRQVSRLTGSLFLIRADGLRHRGASDALALRSVGLLVRLRPPAVGMADSNRVAPLTGRAWVQLY